MVEILVARIGQRHMARGALEQPRAEVTFEVLDAFAHHGIGKVQPPCGLRKAVGLRHGDKGDNVR
jgi:hypothetical protein